MLRTRRIRGTRPWARSWEGRQSVTVCLPPNECAQLKCRPPPRWHGVFFPLRGPLCAGEAFIPSRPGGASAAQCYMARRDVGPRFVPRYRSLLHPTYLRWLLKQKGCGQMQRGSRNLNRVQKVYTENYVLAENDTDDRRVSHPHKFGDGSIRGTATGEFPKPLYLLGTVGLDVHLFRTASLYERSRAYANPCKSLRIRGKSL